MIEIIDKNYLNQILSFLFKKNRLTHMTRRQDLINRLAQQDQELEALNGDLPPSSNNEERVVDKIFESLTISEMKILTNFTKVQIMDLYALFESDIVGARSNRGRGSKLSPLDSFILLLCFLKSYSSFSRLALDFEIKPATVQRIVESLIDVLAPKFAEKLIKVVKKELQIANGIGFENYPDVALVLDCSVQEVSRFAGSFRKLKSFFH